FLGKFTYGIADDAWLGGRSVFWPFGEVTHLNGDYASAKDKQSGFVFTATLFIPAGKGAQGAKIVLEEVAGREIVNVTEKAAVKGGETAATKLGRLMHTLYHASDVLDKVRIKEFILPSGNRIDFIDLEKKIIYELKPNNPRAIKLGYQQLATYLKEVESIYGTGFKTVLDTY